MNYQLKSPNFEVTRSLSTHIIDQMTPMDSATFNTFYVRFNKALVADNIVLFCQTLHDFFPHVPYTIHIGQEKYFQSIFFIIAKLLGAHILRDALLRKAPQDDRDSDVATNTGRIDAIIERGDHIYVIEFKINKTTGEAIEQIKTKKYSEMFRQTGKSVTLVGINFDLEEKNIRTDWIIEQL